MPTKALARFLPIFTLIVLPVWWLTHTGGDVLGSHNMDLVGHLNTMHHASMGQPLRTTMVAWPEGADLLVIVGGWLDIFLAAPLVDLVGLRTAYNLVFVFYAFLAGLGCWVLARVLGASPWAAAAAGVLLQLDGFVLRNMTDGRLEQGALGLVALAVAGAIHSWRKPGWWVPVGTGLAGAAVVFASWELALFLGVAMALLAPFICTGERAPGAVKRWAVAAGVAALLAGPWAGLFYLRASAVRDLREGLTSLEDARIHSVALLGWFAARVSANPPTMALLALPALPWTLRARDRRLWLGIGGVMLLGMVMAMGPDPGLWRPGDIAPDSPGWGLWTYLQGVPFLGWFHTPDRFLCVWSLVAPLAAALLLERIGRLPRGLWLAVPLGLAMAVTAVVEAHRGFQWPHGGYHVPDTPALRSLAAIEGDGPVLDLPPRTHRLHVLPYQAAQLTHGRPIPYHMTLPALTTDVVGPLMQREPFFEWFRQQVSGVGPRPALEPDALVSLRNFGFRFLVLNSNQLPPPSRGRVVQSMENALGPPLLREGTQWICWELPVDQTSE